MVRIGRLGCHYLEADELHVDAFVVDGDGDVTAGTGSFTDVVAEHDVSGEVGTFESVDADTGVFKRVTIEDLPLAAATTDAMRRDEVADGLARYVWAISWKYPVADFVAAASLPPAPAAGTRYVVTDGASKNSVYTWVQGVGWSISAPSHGWAVLRVSNQLTYIYSEGESPANWILTGLTWDHTRLVNAGTLTHATIDSRLGQDVSATASPSFAGLVVTGTGDSTSTSTGAATIAGGLGVAKHIESGTMWSECNAVANTPHGFPDNAESVLQYDASTRVFSIQKAGVNIPFNVWVQGRKYTYNSTQTAAPHSASTGLYYYYFDFDGLHLATEFPDIRGYAICAIVYYYSATEAFCTDERHGTIMDAETHMHLHNTVGAYKYSGFELLDVSPPTETLTNLRIAQGVIGDEDLLTTVREETAGSHRVSHILGATETWRFSTKTVPFNYTTTGYVEWNDYNSGTWRLVPATANKFVNYYACAVPAITDAHQIYYQPGQAEYSTLAAAQAEDYRSLRQTAFRTPEILPLYQLTFGTSASYSGLGKCRLESATLITGSAKAIMTTVPSHNGLTGLQSAAAAVTYGHVTDGAQSIAGAKTFSDSTDSSSIITGGAIVSGGLGVAKKLHVGDAVTVHNASDTSKTLSVTVDANGDATLDASGNDVKFANTDVVSILNPVGSTSSTTGALQIIGGIGCKMSVNADGYLNGGSIGVSDLVTGATFKCSGRSSPNAEYTLSASGGAATYTGALSGGKIGFTGTQSWEVPCDTATSSVQSGTWRFKYTPTFNSGASVLVTMLMEQSAANSEGNIKLTHDAQNARISARSTVAGTGVVIVQAYFPYTCVNGREDEIYFVYATLDSNPSVRLWLNGTEVTVTPTPTYGAGARLTPTKLTSNYISGSGSYAIRDIATWKTAIVPNPTPYNPGYAVWPEVGAPCVKASSALDATGKTSTAALSSTGGIMALRTIRTASRVAAAGMVIEETSDTSTATLKVEGYKSLNADYTAGAGGLACTTSGTVALSGGKIAVSANSSIAYQTGAGVDGGATGAVRWKYTPSYSGYPASGSIIFGNPSAVPNQLRLNHLATGFFELTVYSSKTPPVHTLLYTQFMNQTTPWSAVSGREYEMEFDWDSADGTANSGSYILFIDGVLYAQRVNATASDPVTTRGTLATWTFGSTNLAFGIRDMCLFTSVQHTASYTPGYSTVAAVTAPKARVGALELLYPTDWTKKVDFAVDSSGNGGLTASGGTLAVTSGTALSVLKTTAATAIDAAAATVVGGLGVGNGLHVAGSSVLHNASIQAATATVAVDVDGLLSVTPSGASMTLAKPVNTTGNLTVSYASDTSKTLTLAADVDGKGTITPSGTSLTVPKALLATANVASTNTTSGSVVVTGGLGVSGDINCTALHGQVDAPDYVSTERLVVDGAAYSGVSLVAENYVSLNADYTVGAEGLVAATSGTVAISSGKAKLTGGTTPRLVYPVDSTNDGGQTGAVRLKFTPAFSGAPPQAFGIEFTSSDGTTEVLSVQFETNGDVRFAVFVGGIGKTVSGYVKTGFSAVAGREYAVEMDWDFTGNAHRLFIDGVSAGAVTCSATRTKVGAGGKLRVYSGLATDLLVRDLMLFTAVQHTADHSSAYSSIRTAHTPSVTVHCPADKTKYSTITANSSGELVIDPTTKTTLTSSWSGPFATPLANVVFSFTKVGNIVHASAAVPTITTDSESVVTVGGNIPAGFFNSTKNTYCPIFVGTAQFGLFYVNSSTGVITISNGPTITSPFPALTAATFNINVSYVV